MACHVSVFFCFNCSYVVRFGHAIILKTFWHFVSSSFYKFACGVGVVGEASPITGHSFFQRWCVVCRNLNLNPPFLRIEQKSFFNNYTCLLLAFSKIPLWQTPCPAIPWSTYVVLKIATLNDLKRNLGFQALSGCFFPLEIEGRRQTDVRAVSALLVVIQSLKTKGCWFDCLAESIPF